MSESESLSFQYVRELEARVRELESENSSLRHEHANTRRLIRQFFGADEYSALEDGLYGLYEQIVALRAVLKPFAVVGSEVPASWGADIAGVCRFPTTDLRRAFWIYRETGEDGGAEWQTAQ